MFDEGDLIRVKNEKTRMDICVDDYKETSGPLGGTTVEYQIKVDTTRLEYKSNYQRETTVVSFTVHKTFKEIEYFFKKLKAKYPDVVVDMPNFTCEDQDTRKRVAHDLMTFIAKHEVLISSALLFGFLGYDPNKNTVDSTKTQSKSKTNGVEVRPSTSPDDRQPNTDVIRNQKENSEDIFVEEKNSEPNDYEDLFQEFKRQRPAVSGDSSSALFRDSPTKKPQFESRKDTLFLFSRQEMGGTLQGDELDMNGLFVSSDGTKTSKTKNELDSTSKVEEMEELLTIDDSLSDIWNEIKPKKMVKVPEMKPKPVIAPKPLLPPKPNLKASPTTDTSGKKVPVPVPVPAPRNKPVPTPRRSSSASIEESSATTSGKVIQESQNTVETKETPEAGNLSAMDILSYIDSEQKFSLI